MEGFEAELALLCSHEKLSRDKGYGLLQTKIATLTKHSKSVSELEQNILKTLKDNPSQEKAWEATFGNLQASKLLIEAKQYSQPFVDEVKIFSLKLISHEEFRVRIAAGEVLGALCKYVSTDVYSYCEKQLVNSIKENLDRHIQADEKTAEIEVFRDAKDIFHDSAGWKCLETSMKSLKSVIEGCQDSFLQYLNQELLNLIFETLKHTNRFVRETGYYVCSALVRHGVRSSSQCREHVGDFGRQLADHLKIGLADNWSQVRLAASVATREFFLDLSDQDRDQYYAILLPPMCLNRYYLAEGVRLFNQETWKQVVRENGKQLVVKYIREIVDFYVTQTLSDNHAVREAACHCMAELASKIDASAVLPHVLKLLNALLVCFKDESWPVRDTACVACGSFVRSFPEESKASMDELYPLFFTNLSDPIPSVRHGAAIALADIAEAYGTEALDKVFDKVKDGLGAVEHQPDNAEKFESLEKGPATYGVVKRIRGNDMELHSNQQMYSCGSLAPKMGRGGGGCSNHSFKRDSQPWELTDGCIYALAELSANKSAAKMVTDSFPLLAKAVSYRHYSQHFHLLETFCSRLYMMAEGLGKRLFKVHLELFLDAIFDGLASDNQLTHAAAKESLIMLGGFLGQNILKGRVENYNPIYMKHLDEVLGNQAMQY